MSTAEFTELLGNEHKKFGEWAIMGLHDNENLLFPEIQISKNIILSTPESFQIYSSAHYYEYIYSNVKLNFGVPFIWTYPSKQRGRRIKLKLPIRGI